MNGSHTRFRHLHLKIFSFVQSTALQLAHDVPGPIRLPARDHLLIDRRAALNPFDVCFPPIPISCLTRTRSPDAMQPWMSQSQGNIRHSPPPRFMPGAELTWTFAAVSAWNP